MMETFNSSDRPSIDMLNLEKTQTYIGGIVLTSVLVIIGILGNVHVLIVFGFKMKSSNHTTFILCLGIVDTIACSVGMPLTILDLTRPFTFHDDISCKIGQLVNYFMSASSALILLTITVDRYRKICHSMSRQLSNCMAKIICAIIICLSFTLSMPTFFYFGRNTVQLEYANITVTRCSTRSKYVASRLPLIFNAVLAGLALTVFTVLTVLYTLIIRAINKRGKFKYQQSNEDNRRPAVLSLDEMKTTLDELNRPQESEDSRRPAVLSLDEMKTTLDGLNRPQESEDSRRPAVLSLNKSLDGLNKPYETHPVVMLDRLNKTQEQTSSAAQTNSANNLSLTARVEYQSPEHTLKDDSNHRHVTNQPDLARETARIAIIFFVIVVIFFISYLPNLFLTVNLYMNYDYFHHLSKEKAILYNTFKWFFFINNAANPIVYLFLDVKFRSHLKSFYCKLIKPFKQIGLSYPQQ